MERLLAKTEYLGALYLLLIFAVLVVVAFGIKRLLINYKWSMRRVDKMKGDDFENFVKEIYLLLGYTAEKTKKSGDQGIDLIVKKHFKRIGVQLKRYSGSVGNSAVQEAVAGKKFYKLDKVCVLTNRHFTRSAKELAKVNNVELLDREDLKLLIKKARRKEEKNGK